MVFPSGLLEGDARQAFLAGLANHGLREPSTLAIAWRESNAMKRLDVEVAQFQPDILLVASTMLAIEARSAAPDLPLVAWGVSQRVVGHRLKNSTGVTPAVDIERRRLDVLREIVPSLQLVAAAYDAAYPPGRLALDEIQRVAVELGLELRVYEIGSAHEIKPALLRMSADRIDAIRVMNSPLLGRRDMAQEALDLGLPLMGYDWTTRAGGLASLTPNFVNVGAIFAEQVARIIDGALPDSIPITEERACWLALNLLTADRLDLKIGSSLLARADEIVRN